MWTNSIHYLYDICFNLKVDFFFQSHIVFVFFLHVFDTGLKSSNY